MASKKVEVKYTKLFINNQFVDSVSKKTFEVLNPSTGKPITNVAEGDKEDIDKAVRAAKAAFARGAPWRSMDASSRGAIINKFADLVEQHLDEISELEVLENGKTLEFAKMCIQFAVSCYRYYAGFCDKVYGQTIPADGPIMCMTRKEPIGVVGQIIPWNFPALMLTWKWGPALAAGCTLVLKPAEQTPLTALYMAALTKEAGFPDGVINVVNGFGPTAGASLALHKDVRKIAFTGSTDIGHLIMEYAAKSNLKKVSLELGGKSPLVVFDDYDVDEAVKIAGNAIFGNHGQSCCAGSRTYVQSGIYDKFVKKAAEYAKTITVGDPFAQGTVQGPQIDVPSLNKILTMIESGKKQGAKLETGGSRIGTQGYFVQPTVFSNVTDDMTIAREEIFGPVQSILKFDTLEEIIERANDTEYGLAAGVITNNLTTALTYARAVEAGSVWINCYDDAIRPQTPFGGYKKSGIGRDLGPESVYEYLETKTITIKMPSKF
ncbi:aldehyde dehydrogenase 1A1 [Diabrotica virgifera virgifera]|uniref:Aldehyde dehydrogenase domain-containing protein n=1 Tax=Diabrotica virgifera virgifera TaxID=50390 RepID=A0ABM5KQ57_DIAVI|nr:aldehyde dehydrogenase 1A1 [Diabrotica virgifera virgifera]